MFCLIDYAFASPHKRKEGGYHANNAWAMGGVQGTFENCKARTSEFSATSARDVTAGMGASSDSTQRNNGFKNEEPRAATLGVMECTESMAGIHPWHASKNSYVVALRCAANAGV